MVLHWIRSLIALIMGMVMSVSAVQNPASILQNDLPMPEPVAGEVFELTEQFVIVSAMDKTNCTYSAALTLQKYLKQIAGLSLRIVDDSQNYRKEIIVGPTARRDMVYYPGLGDDGYCIRTTPEQILITGGKTRGTLYGVYAFLEDCFACRWYTENLSVIPTVEKAMIPIYEKTYTPPFEYRETDWISPNNSANHEYSIANRLDGGTYRALSAQEGGTVGYIGSFAHTLTTQFCSAATYFDSNPELFALGKSGKRTPDQLCLTNPDTLKLVTKEVLEQIAKNPGKKIVSLTQNDNQNYCRCEACRAMDAKEGSPSGTLLRFVNAVAEQVEQAGYTGIEVDTFAYQYTRKPPEITVPRDNVIVRLCSIECCFAHPLSDENCPENVQFAEDIVRWSEICQHLYIWDYTTNYSNYIGPFPNFGVMQANMQFFADHHVIGIYEEGNYTARESDGEFAELRAYLLARLLWDPDMDYDREMNGFLCAYYGENSWQYIRAYIDKTTAAAGMFQNHMPIYASMRDGVLTLTASDRKYMDLLWSEAKKNAEDAVSRQRICKSELSWRYWKACNCVDEFSVLKPETRKLEQELLFKDFQLLGIRRLHEGNKGLLTDSPDFNARPNTWTVD